VMCKPVEKHNSVVSVCLCECGCVCVCGVVCVVYVCVRACVCVRVWYVFTKLKFRKSGKAVLCVRESK